MKNSGKCPKCGEEKVIRIPGYSANGFLLNAIYAGLFKSNVLVTRYVCGGCGFSEEWIDSLEDIEKLRKKYSQ